MRNTILSKTLLGLLLIASTASLNAQNAYMQNGTLPRYIKAGVNYPISVWARNLGPAPLPSFTIRWKLDGGTWNVAPAVNVTPPGLSSASYVPFTHPVQLNTTQGAHVVVIEILSINDSDPSNNTLTFNFTALTNSADKVVLLEARTETWCQQCPPSNTATNTLMMNPDFAVGKFHLSDALDDCTECTTYYNQHNINYTPAGIIEMGEYGGYAITSQYPGWNDAMTARAAGVSPVELTMTSSVNNSTRVINITLAAEFTYAVAGTYALNLYVAEDGVAGPQTNAPANYIHNKVMRAMLGGATGTTGVVPNTPVVGTTYQQNYSYTVPANYNISNLHFIGVLEHSLGGFNNRFAINVVKGAAVGVGIAELRLGDQSLEAYPNPFNDELYVSVEDVNGSAIVELFSLDGRSVYQNNIVLNGMASTRLDLGASGLANGAYLLRVVTERGSAEQRVIKVD